jgi:hypothetical protein
VGEAFFGVPAAAGHLRSGAGQHEVLAMGTVVGDQLLGLRAEQGLGQWVDEDQWRPVDDEMGCAGGGCGQGRAARLSGGGHAVDCSREFRHYSTKMLISQEPL